MLEHLLSLLNKGGVQSLDELGEKLGVSRPMLEAMIQDLVSMGYLSKVDLACNSQCAGCSSHQLCAIMGSGQMWSLTSKGRRAIERQTSAQ